MIVHVKLPRTAEGERVIPVEWPVIPREGEYVCSDAHDFKGIVRSLTYYENAFEEFVVQIQLK